MQPHRVVIVGGGFGGLYLAKALRRAPAQITLIDRRNFHLFQPLLYQVATGGLSPANIAAPLRSIFRHSKNVRVLLGEASGFDLAGRRLRLASGDIEYDTLVVATGSTHSYFGHSDWEERAPGLKSIEDATDIRRRVFLAFEAAERAGDPSLVREWLTFVVVGGGPTGVELAGALAEIAFDTLKHEFRAINPADSRIKLVEHADRVLPAYTPDLSEKAKRQLEQLGVEVQVETLVTEIDDASVTLKQGDKTERLATHTVLWGAGVQASPLGRELAREAGVEMDRAGRIIVEPDLTVQGHPEVFVIGDLAHCRGEDGELLPGVAPVAMQQGRYVAKRIRLRARGKPETLKPFRYFDRGTMATIGRRRAVAMIGTLHLSGTLAWVTWLFVHLMYLVQFQNRVLVLVQWAWNYLTWNRAARLITGVPDVGASVPQLTNLPTLPRVASVGDGRAASDESRSTTDEAGQTAASHVQTSEAKFNHEGKSGSHDG
ncbi:MAG: NAD(P)/FAD-dependent oxidoreductase [Planctomycetota bacterium]